MKEVEVSKFKIADAWISQINFEKAFNLLSHSAKGPESKYILFPDLSVISQTSKNSELARIIDAAYLVMPDGKPSEMIARIRGLSDVRTVSGYKLFLSLLKETDKTHFLYGSTSRKLEKIKDSIGKNDFDQTKILGYKEAPFLELSEIRNSKEIKEDFIEINKLKPDFIWVGVSSPKQDYILYHHHHVVDQGYLLGVGGVFDYLSGDVKISPEWVKKIGLRWLYRLSKEPKRLFPKYLAIFRNLPNLLFKK